MLFLNATQRRCLSTASGQTALFAVTLVVAVST